jgi:pimeloyl-ACP methyl ester carboxylesterase
MLDVALVTVHGLWSAPATWDRLTSIWQSDEQLRGLRVHAFGYASPKTRNPLSSPRLPNYDDIAQTLAIEYSTVLEEASNLMFVTHSQGGLILQRFLARMIDEGRARELSRVHSVVMLACPNRGSEYLRSVRQVLGVGRHLQAGNLEALDRQVAESQRTVLQRIVNATGVDDYQCRIPFHVYAGSRDYVVPADSAQSVFPNASTLAGDHFSILDPAAPGNRTAEVVKRHILTDVSSVPQPEQDRASKHPSINRGDRSKYVVRISGGQGVQVGDHNVQRNVFWTGASADEE